MTKRELVNPTLIAGIGSSATALALDLTSVLDFTPWEIALSFPLGAVAFLATWFLGEALVRS